MYTIHKNVQIILAMLKAYGVQNLVVSAGTRRYRWYFQQRKTIFSSAILL